MLTPEQMQKAREALQRKRSEDLTKKIMLRIYRQDQKTAAELHLPFRMIHKHEYPEGEVQPNLYYPNPSSVMIDTDTGKWIPVPENEKLTDEDMDYWFTRFLTMIDIDGYSDSDLTGERIQPATAATIRDEYRRRIEDYYNNPDRYNTRGWCAGDIDGRRYPKFKP